MDPRRNLFATPSPPPPPPQREPLLRERTRNRSIASSDFANEQERIDMNQGFLDQLPNGTPLARPRLDRNPRGYVRRLNNDDEAVNFPRRDIRAAPQRPSILLENAVDEIVLSFVTIRQDRIQAAMARSGLNHLVNQNVRGNDLVRLQLPNAMVDNFILMALAYNNQVAERTQQNSRFQEAPNRIGSEEFGEEEEDHLNYGINNVLANRRETTPMNNGNRPGRTGFQAFQRRDNDDSSLRSVSPTEPIESPAFFDNEGILRSRTNNSASKRRREE